jgi:hypothetical protein
MAGLVGAAVVVLRAGDAALRGVVVGSGAAHGVVVLRYWVMALRGGEASKRDLGMSSGRF